jgi:RND superfamily putative drug exporter
MATRRRPPLLRWGSVAARHHRWVIAAWIVLVVGLGVLAGATKGAPRDVFTVPGTSAQDALDLLQQKFPEENDPTATVVFAVPKGDSSLGKVTDPANEKAIGDSITALGKIRDVTSVSDPYTTTAGTDATVSPNGLITYATVTFSKPVPDLPKDTLDAMRAATTPATDAGLDVQYGGPVVDVLSQPPPGLSAHADQIGLGLAVVILLLSLGSVPAMLCPLVIAVTSVAASNLLLTSLEAESPIGTIAPILGTMLGLGVGIDYSLFIVSRHRQALHGGLPVERAVGLSVATSGSAVLFAGITVCMATCGLALIGIPYVATLGFASAMYVAMSVLAALTLLPAMLGALGHKVDAWALPWRRRAEAAEATGDPAETWAGRWAVLVTRRAWLFAVGALVLLVLLAAPVLRMELGWPDDGQQPSELTQRKAYDLVSEGFGDGANGKLLVTVSLPTATAEDEKPEIAALEALVKALGDTRGVGAVTPPIPDKELDAAVIVVAPTTGPSDPETADLVTRLRTDVVPTALEGTAIHPDQVDVGGSTAEFIDITDRIRGRIVPFMAAVIAGSFLLLTMVFRSLVVPLKAAVMNLLSIGAAYGVIVAIFQWGWGRGLIGLEETVPIIAFIPLMMFAILFGLSMDYEVFLLSRIREDYLRTDDPRGSVVSGLAGTARVITSAALIMISVFLSYVTNPEPEVKMIGLGMAVAVFVDATIVRMVLVPATMELLGGANWWLPTWLDRVLPHLNVEGPVEGPVDDAREATPQPAT